MEKISPAQASARQALLDRRAAAADRRDPILAADNERINNLYTNTKMNEINTDNVVALVDCPPEVQDLVAKIAPLFKEATGLNFPDTVIYGVSDRGTKPSYWVNGNALPSTAPAMVRRDNKPCNVRHDAKTGAYKFRTPALTTLYSRLLAGKPVLAG